MIIPHSWEKGDHEVQRDNLTKGSRSGTQIRTRQVREGRRDRGGKESISQAGKRGGETGGRGGGRRASPRQAR